MDIEERKQSATRVVKGNCLQLGNGVELPVPQPIQVTTVLFDSVDSMHPVSEDSLSLQSGRAIDRLYYGSVGTPTTDALAANLCILERASGCVLFPSGQAAIHAIMSVVTAPGDEMLVADCVTYTTRWLFDQVIARTGVTVRYFSPHDLVALNRLITPRTRAVFLESPGSMFFEIQDVPAIVRLFRSSGIKIILDNTWAASTYFNAFDTGLVDVVVLSLSKYHGAAMGVSGGAILTRDDHLSAECRNFGALIGASLTSDAASRIATLLPNLPLRLEHQSKTIERLLKTIRIRVPDTTIFHPTLVTSPGHALWHRDFSGANSLLTLHCPTAQAAKDIARKFRVIRHGYGWGGDSSLVNVIQPNAIREYPIGPRDAWYLRFYFGMEHPTDLQEDIDHAFSGVFD